MAVWEQQQNAVGYSCIAFAGELGSEVTVTYNNGNGCYVSDRNPIDVVYDWINDAADNCDIGFMTPIENACLLALGMPSGITSMRTLFYFDGVAVPRSSNVVSATLTLYVEVGRVTTYNAKQFSIKAEDVTNPSFPNTYNAVMAKTLTAVASTFTLDKLSVWSSGTGTHALSSYDYITLQDMGGTSRVFAPITFDVTQLIQYQILQRRWKNPNTLLLCIPYTVAPDYNGDELFAVLGYSSQYAAYAPKLRIEHDQETAVMLETSLTKDKIQHNHPIIAATATVSEHWQDNWPPEPEQADTVDILKAGFQRDIADLAIVDIVDEHRAGFQTDTSVDNIVVATDDWEATFFLQFDIAASLEKVAFESVLTMSLVFGGELSYVTGVFETSNESYQLTPELEYVEGDVTFGKAFTGMLEQLDAEFTVAYPIHYYTADSLSLEQIVGGLTLGSHLEGISDYVSMTSSLTLGLPFNISGSLKSVTCISTITIPISYAISGSLQKCVLTSSIYSTATLAMSAELATVAGKFSTKGTAGSLTAFRITGYTKRPEAVFTLLRADGRYDVAAKMEHVQVLVTIWNDNSAEDILEYKDKL